MNTTQIGDLSEQKFILFCLENNIPILKPIGNNLPYDCIIDVNSKLYKIQVKTARNTKYVNSIVFNTVCTSKNYTEAVEKDYVGKIDYFVAYHPQINQFYFVSVNEAPIGKMTICVADKVKSNQNSAKNYGFENLK